MSSAYEERYGGNLRKDEVRSIVWKDSQRLTNFLRDNKLLDQVLESNEKIRFLMPIRNPMDCAISNSNSRKSEHLLSRGGSLHDVLGAVCRKIAWFQQQKQRLPDRFFSFFENRFDEATLRDFATFLGLEATPEWVEDALRVYQIKPSYDHDAELVAEYRSRIERYFVNDLGDPEFAETMTRFIA